MRRSVTRRYDSTTRRKKASEAGDRVLAAATRLFSRHGIDCVTVERIAEQADVSVAAVYARFKSKAGLLQGLAHSILLGPRYEAEAKRLEGVTEPEAALRVTAAMARGIYQREHQELGLIRGAAAYSPALKKLEANLERVRRDLQKSRAHLVFEKTPALEPLGLEKVRDVIWLFTGREFYRMLVINRGWEPEEYESFLSQALIRTLLPQRAKMSFQAYLSNIQEKTGKTPEEFRKAAKKSGLLKPELTATQFVNWLASDFALGRGHAMALWKYFKEQGWLLEKRK